MMQIGIDRLVAAIFDPVGSLQMEETMNAIGNLKAGDVRNETDSLGEVDYANVGGGVSARLFSDSEPRWSSRSLRIYCRTGDQPQSLPFCLYAWS